MPFAPSERRESEPGKLVLERADVALAEREVVKEVRGAAAIRRIRARQLIGELHLEIQHRGADFADLRSEAAQAPAIQALIHRRTRRSEPAANQFIVTPGKSLPLRGASITHRRNRPVTTQLRFGYEARFGFWLRG